MGGLKFSAKASRGDEASVLMTTIIASQDQEHQWHWEQRLGRKIKDN